MQEFAAEKERIKSRLLIYFQYRQTPMEMGAGSISAMTLRLFIKKSNVMKNIFIYLLYFFVSMHVQQVPADVYDDIGKSTGGSVTRLPRDDINGAYKQFQNRPPVVPAEQFSGGYSSNQPKWALEKLKIKILSTGTIGPHVGWVYDLYSVEKMANILSSADVPGLLELFSTEKGSTVGIQFALASQCRAGLEGVLMSVQRKTFHSATGNSVDRYVAQEIIKHISDFDRCDMQTRQDAKQAFIRLRNEK